MNPKPPRPFWLLAAALYATLVYSTGLHIAVGPEPTISLDFFKAAPGAGVNDVTARYPDQGRLHDPGRPAGRWLDRLLDTWFASDLWKVSSAWPDSAQYLLQVESPMDAAPPFLYRPVPAIAVAAVVRATGLAAGPAFALLNAVLVLATALIFTQHLLRDYRFAPYVALVGGMLLVTLLPITSTLAFPMLEPASLLFVVLVFMAVVRRRPWLFAVAATLGVLTKEILIVSAPLWFFEAVDWRSRDPGRWAAAVVPALAPILAFGAIRLALGGGAMEVNFGYDLLRGEFPAQYAARLFDPPGLLTVTLRLALAFGALWLGLVNLRRHPFLRRNAYVIVVVVAATLALSGRIIRPLGVLYPILIPAFLLFFPSGTGAWGSREADPEDRS